MLLSIQTAGSLIINVYGKKSINSFEFLHADIHQGKKASETNTFGWVCPGMFSHALSYLDLIQVPLVVVGYDQVKTRSE